MDLPDPPGFDLDNEQEEKITKMKPSCKFDPHNRGQETPELTEKKRNNDQQLDEKVEEDERGVKLFKEIQKI